MVVAYITYKGVVKETSVNNRGFVDFGVVGVDPSHLIHTPTKFNPNTFTDKDGNILFINVRSKK
ncbi:hypothetical protein ZPAH1_orf00246 [Aeromonas phage ZPAH1]|nr:hypothetical protein ASwh1_197 [Aeromonas phage Aswh_1]QQG34008.1 hypothetical protein ZPAH1_orf00246 [Aeromonas phage ZPAH1]